MRSCFFPTPPSVVDSVVISELTGRYRRVLEPAVGDGALLSGLRENYDEVVAYDVDQENLAKAVECIDASKAKFVCADFLSADVFGKFDLILSNPPFNNNLAHYVEYENRRMAIEVAFVKKCLGLLSDSGFAIFILPSSVIVGERTKWLREYIIDSFTVESVLKLARFSFKSVEGGFYVVKIRNKHPVCGYNIRLSTGSGCEYFLNSSVVIEQDYCLDPERLACSASYSSMVDELGYTCFSDLVDVRRGNVGATGNKTHLYHSTDFKSHAAVSKKYLKGLKSSALLTRFCIVLKRVGRSASDSFSLYLGKALIPCSDCVFVIVPKESSELHSVKLLLALRVSVILGGGADFEISGSGANYISLTRLKKFKVVSLTYFDDRFLLLQYRDLLSLSNKSSARALEDSLAKKILSGFMGKVEAEQRINSLA